MTDIIFENDDFALTGSQVDGEVGVVVFPPSSKPFDLSAGGASMPSGSNVTSVVVARKRTLKLNSEHLDEIGEALGRIWGKRWVAVGSEAGALDALSMVAKGTVAGAIVLVPAKPLDEVLAGELGEAANRGAIVAQVAMGDSESPHVPGARRMEFPLHTRQLSSILADPNAYCTAAAALIAGDMVAFTKAFRAGRLGIINTYKPLLQAAGKNTTRLIKITDVGLRYLPNHPQLILARSRALVAQDRADEAMALVEAAYQHDPSVANIATTYSTLLENDGRLVEAISVMERSLVENQDVNTSKRLVRLLSSTGRHDDAIRRLKDAMDENPDAPALQALAEQLMPEAASETVSVPQDSGANATDVAVQSATSEMTGPAAEETTSAPAQTPSDAAGSKSTADLAAPAQSAAQTASKPEPTKPAPRGLKGLFARLFR